ncbi:MAG: hypothetical protein NTV30_04240, partial [Chloroflexi bacterium]|nr:hypothetical protein [Chloroflexota bacterium]
VLKALNEIKFPVGKNLLIDFLKGDIQNASVKKNDLYELYNFAVLRNYTLSEIKKLIDNHTYSIVRIFLALFTNKSCRGHK